VKAIFRIAVAATIPMLMACSSVDAEAEGVRVAPPVFPSDEVDDEVLAQSQADEFMSWARLDGTEEQAATVYGHVEIIAGDWSTPSGLAYIATDLTDESRAVLVAEAFSQWAAVEDHEARAAVYGEEESLLYTDD
jgi:hypothetical protein